MSIPLFRLAPLVWLAVGLLTTPALQAATTTLVGTGFDLSFEHVPFSLLGVPTLQGNAIVFSPVGFKAESMSGQGEVIAEQALSMHLALHSGQRITAITLTEQGSYRLSGQQSDVSVWGELRTDLAGGAPALVAAISPTDYFFPNPGVVQAWTASSTLASSAVAGSVQAQGITVDVHNALQGFTRPSDVGTRTASIEMGGNLVLSVSLVPEPASTTLVLTGLGLSGGALAGRNRRS